MLVKVLKMQSGEQVISGIAELMDEENKGIGFELYQPYLLTLVPNEDVGENGTPNSFSVNYTKWVSCSADTKFRVPYAAVVALGEPEEQVLTTYKEKFGELFINREEPENGSIPESDTSYNIEESGLSDSGD